LEKINPRIYRIFRTTPSMNSGDDLGNKQCGDKLCDKNSKL
jgi:hypothetical protein